MSIIGDSTRFPNSAYDSLMCTSYAVKWEDTGKFVSFAPILWPHFVILYEYDPQLTYKRMKPTKFQ